MKRLIRLFLVLFFTLFSWQYSLADDTQNKALLEEANSAYHERDYELAIKLYEQLIAANGYSAKVLYNLANTYAQNGETGKAVLNYQRARLLNPGDPDITGNLEVVNKKAGLFDEERPFFNKLTNSLTFNQWCGVGLFTFAFFVAATAAVLFFPRFKNTARSTAALCFLLTVLSIYLAAISYHPYLSGVIIQAEAALLISPHEKASTNGSIREGRLVRLLKEYNDFRYVEDTSGRTGWVAKQAVEAIRPNSPQ